ncbi:MAG: hypothetical protein P8074_18590 [Anaerolineales bacterium]
MKNQKALQELLEQCAEHSHLYPRRVLGVRRERNAGQILRLSLPQC